MASADLASAAFSSARRCSALRDDELGKQAADTLTLHLPGPAQGERGRVIVNVRTVVLSDCEAGNTNVWTKALLLLPLTLAFNVGARYLSRTVTSCAEP
jgi:hypothetical protein